MHTPYMLTLYTHTLYTHTLYTHPIYTPIYTPYIQTLYTYPTCTHPICSPYIHTLYTHTLYTNPIYTPYIHTSFRVTWWNTTGPHVYGFAATLCTNSFTWIAFCKSYSNARRLPPRTRSPGSLFVRAIVMLEGSRHELVHLDRFL